MFGADVGVVERLGFLSGEGEDLFDARGVRDGALVLSLLTSADLLLDRAAHGLEIEAHFLKDAHRDALAELDQAEQEVLGADVVVMKTVSLLSSEGEDLLCTRSEVIHRFHKMSRVLRGKGRFEGMGWTRRVRVNLLRQVF